MSYAKSVAGSTFGQQQQPQQKHAKTQQQKFTKATASQTNSSTNQTLTTTTQTVNCSQASPAPSSSKTSTSTSPMATATYMASSNCSSSSFSFESGVVLSGSSGCSSLSNSPTSSSSSNPYLASLAVPTNSLCANNASQLDDSFSSTSCILNSSLLAAVNGDLEDESKIMSQTLSDTLCFNQNKADNLQINEDNSGQQQMLLENINHHHHPQLSVTETTCLNTEDARTLQLAVELTMLNLNQLPSPTTAAATSSSSPSTTTTTNNFQQLLQQPHLLHSSLDQPYSSYTSVSNPYHMTTKVFLQTQSQADAATLLNQKFLSDTSLSNSPTKLNTLPNHNQTLGGTVVTIDDRSKKSQNMTECVPVPSSEHVAEIVGRQELNRIGGSSLSNPNGMESQQQQNQRPYFDDINSRNVTTVADETAILKCRVKNKGNRTVSWMRKRDLHILTTNIYTYTGDQRFSVVHAPGSDDWDLKIEYAQQRDSGIYECQVNTEPKINLAVMLDVTAARAKILGSTEIHVKRDSTIALACSVNIHASSVLWYHGSSVVDFDSLRGGISLETEKTDTGTTSRLMLTRASLRDSGNYTCLPVGAIPASVRVHVLTGEQPAAMQTSKGIGIMNNAHLAIVTVCIFSIAAWHYSTISQVSNLISVYNELPHKHLFHTNLQQHRNQHSFNNTNNYIGSKRSQESWHRSHRMR